MNIFTIFFLQNILQNALFLKNFSGGGGGDTLNPLSFAPFK